MADNDKTTTINLTEGTKKALDDLKIHTRQPYEEIIKELITRNHKMKGELNLTEKKVGDVSNINKSPNQRKEV